MKTIEQIKVEGQERAIDDWISHLSGKAFNDNMLDLSDGEIQRVFGNCVLATRLISHMKFMREKGMTLQELLNHEDGSLSLNKYHKFSRMHVNIATQLAIF